MKSSKSRANIPDPADIFIQTTESLVNGLERVSRKEPLLSRSSSIQRVRSAVKRSRAGEHLWFLYPPVLNHPLCALPIFHALGLKELQAAGFL